MDQQISSIFENYIVEKLAWKISDKIYRALFNNQSCGDLFPYILENQLGNLDIDLGSTAQYDPGASENIWKAYYARNWPLIRG